MAGLPFCFEKDEDLEGFICKGMWSNKFLYRKCMSCFYCPMNLCENCDESFISGPHLGCNKQKGGKWLRRSSGVYLESPGTRCKNYVRKFRNKRLRGFHIIFSTLISHIKELDEKIQRGIKPEKEDLEEIVTFIQRQLSDF